MAYKRYEAKLNWAKVYEHNRETAARAKATGTTHEGVLETLEKVDGKYTVDMLVTEEVKDQMIKDGVPTKKKNSNRELFQYDEDEDLWVYKAERNHFNPNLPTRDEDGNPTGEKGVVQGPPQVIDYNATMEQKEIVPFEELIGNGSEAYVRLKIDRTPKHTYVNLDGVAITNHVEFEGNLF